MTTILTVGNSEGSRRCDSKCHDAAGPECDCVCGGRYHGRGDQTAAEAIQTDVKAGLFGDGPARVARDILAGVQMSLFDGAADGPPRSSCPASNAPGPFSNDAGQPATTAETSTPGLEARDAAGGSPSIGPQPLKPTQPTKAAAGPGGRRPCPCGRPARWGSTKCAACDPWRSLASIRSGAAR